MRAAILVRRFPKLSETFILGQITGLVDAGIDVDIFALKPGEDDAVHPQVQKYELMRRTHYLQPPRSPVARVAGAIRRVAGHRVQWWQRAAMLRSVRSPLHGGTASAFSLLYAGASFFATGPHDVVHCQFGNLGLMALRLRQMGALPGRIVVSFRGADLTVEGAFEHYAELFRVADLFLPVCGAFADRLVAMGCNPDRIRVHRSGTDLNAFPFAGRGRGPNEPTHFITVARLVEKKGVEYGIRAVARLAAGGRRVRYTIVGDGELRRSLEQLAASLGAADVVRFTGPLDRDGVAATLRDAHVLVAPSVTGADGDQEGIPNVLKEAMASGMPVASTLHSGIPELVDDGVSGFLVPERNPEALAERLALLADSPDRWPAMGRAGRARVEAEYDRERLNGQLVDMYRAVVAARPIPSSAEHPSLVPEKFTARSSV
jgi:colanic acid/amylovoran biosynthesis glycosyltransferase